MASSARTAPAGQPRFSWTNRGAPDKSVIAGGRLIGCRSRGTGDDAPLSARSNRGAQRWLNGCTRTLPDVPQTEGESHSDKGWLSGEWAEDPPLARHLESMR